MEIELAAGYPAIYLNAGSRWVAWQGTSSQYEFVLPSFIMNEKGDFVPVEYEIKEKTRKNFVTKFFSEDLGALLLAKEQTEDVYVVTPKFGLTYDSGKFKSFADYQRHYVALACLPKNYGEKETTYAYFFRTKTGAIPEMEEMCEKAREFYEKER